METLLTLAASADSHVRSVALKYFLDNRTTKYSDYKLSAVAHIAFVPAVRGNTECLVKPSEVSRRSSCHRERYLMLVWQAFASHNWAKFGLPVAKLDQDAVVKLGIPEHPPTSVLVSILQDNPPDNEAVARDWFGSLTSRIAGEFDLPITSSNVRMLTHLFQTSHPES